MFIVLIGPQSSNSPLPSTLLEAPVTEIQERMNSIAKSGWNLFSRSNSFHPLQQQQQWRGIQVSVKNGNLEQALAIMERKMKQSGMERLIKRQQTHHLKNSEKRILAQKKLHNRLQSEELARKLQSILIKKVRGL